MSPEKPKNSADSLTRKQKLARRFLPLALLAGGAATVNHLHSDHDQSEPHYEAQSSASAMALAGATVEFGGSETDWGHGTAETAIKEAVEKGLSKVAVEASDTPSEPLNVQQVLEHLAVYDQAEAVLEMAHYNDVLPDEGDKLSVKVEVTLDSEQNVSYEVTDAEILDLPNNQG